MTFEEDLTKKRVDVAAFAAGDPDRFAEWRQMYAQMHPNSFYISVKMVLNDVRRRFWLAEAVKPVLASVPEVAAKPAARRATIPGAAKQNLSATEMNTLPPPTTEPTESAENKPAAPVRGRAIIRKPAAANPDETNAPERIPPTIADTAAETPATPPNPRPRPIIRKPVTISPEETTSQQEQIAQDNTNHATAFHTNPDPAPEMDKETAAPKPPRPRPVIKRPAANSASKDEETSIISNQDLPTKTEEGTKLAEAPKEPAPSMSPRPRPVMRRPSPPAESNVNPMSEAAVSPGTEKPVGEEPSGELAAALPKPPRPRPVIKRPPKPDNNQEQ